jgi:cytochrome c biogenesis protein CcdA
MDGLLAQLIPVAVAGALTPLPFMVVVTLLMSKRGLAKAACFAAAMLTVFTVIGVITLTTSGTQDGSGRTGSAVTGTIIAVLGVLFVLFAVKQWLNAPDPDAPPPKFMTALETMTVGRATVFGAILALINIKQLGIFVGGVAQIVHADVSATHGLVALAVFLFLLQIGVIAPLVAFVAARDWAMRNFHRVLGWLVSHNRVIAIVLGLVVGAAFTVRGITQIA